MIENLAVGFSASLSPENLLWCLIGVVVGTVIGMLPGLGATTGIAILIPLTLGMDPLTALIMLAGIYYGCQYGSTISAVLIATPGDANAVSTVIDGYAMARNGRAGAALAISAIGSFVAAIVSVVLLATLAGPIADLAIGFGPAENFAIMVFAMATIVAFSGADIRKGLMMAGLGIALSTVGVAMGFTTARFTGGSVNLLGGLDFVVVMIGIFAIGEVLSQISAGGAEPIRARFRDMLITRKELRQASPAIARGTGIGFVFGSLPGAGSTLASFLAYGVEKSVSKTPERFGKGAIQGVAAPESANNSAANANFIPTLSLGIPGGSTTAVLLGAFIMYGVQPGPLLFTEQPTLVWGLITSFFIGNVILLVLNLPLAPAFAQILRLPYNHLYPFIIFFSLIGAFAVAGNTFGLIVVLVASALGFCLKKFGYPSAPLILGLVLGPMTEKALVQTSAFGRGDLSILLQSPVAMTILILAVVLAAAPILSRSLRERARRKRDLETAAEASAAEREPDHDSQPSR
ncbi:tripartite tricarboxylate transporter permease [Rothia halotolerans]|uniref:tripartite tricarboxylate transporter permease n=1 Tax=Rothia halotolerans TaxID=405770 RepID=UPI00101D03AE|nr:tripartite tricarboxylate transporter permease [Rothia halotolerans]